MPDQAREENGRAAWIAVDLSAIFDNVKALSCHSSPGVEVMAVVKADGYGHGAVEVARTALSAGASWLGVATIREAAELRQAQIGSPILVLGPSTLEEAISAADLDVAVTAGTMNYIEKLSDLAPGTNALDVHLKIDTGMNRFGVASLDAVQAASLLHENRNVRLAGVFSHLARADEIETDQVDAQAELFRTSLSSIEAAGIDPGTRHLCNSAATIRFPGLHFDLVRAGISIYGIRPSAEVQLLPGMRPAMTVQCRAQRVWTPENRGQVGYGGTYLANEGDRLVLLPLGYGDGYPRTLSNRGWVGWNGKRLDVVGRVSMDQMVVRTSATDSIAFDDTLEVMGTGRNGGPTADQIAELVGTIPYETVVSFGLRLPKRYLR